MGDALTCSCPLAPMRTHPSPPFLSLYLLYLFYQYSTNILSIFSQYLTNIGTNAHSHVPTLPIFLSSLPFLPLFYQYSVNILTIFYQYWHQCALTLPYPFYLPYLFYQHLTNILPMILPIFSQYFTNMLSIFFQY